MHLLFFRNAEIHFNLWNHPIRLLQVATYTEKKNQLELLEALQDRHAGRFSLSFYGEFYNQAYVHEIQKVARSKHKHSISINGKLNFEDYLKALRYTHFSMQWSKRTKTNDTEGGCPVFIKDSLGLGRPVIGSRHCDIPDILVHHFNAYLTEEQDLNALTEILDEIMSIDSFTYLKLQRNALQSVHENKSAHLSGRELTEVYCKMINGL
ncbi:MAG: glycosyltransferase [Saprospiraceae bacterium]|nr:glycosyltransferase [Saprospiraceae bacterium]